MLYFFNISDEAEISGPPEAGHKKQGDNRKTQKTKGTGMRATPPSAAVSRTICQNV
jgi:hypothetical protein